MKNLSVFLLFIFFQATLAQQTAVSELPTASPQTVGISPDRLSRIEAMLENAVSQQQIPGAVALIARKGKVVFHKAFGQADNSEGQELDKNAIFRIASQTKAITATAVMILWEEGLFRLDDPISKYIPEFAEMQVLDTFNPADSSFTGKDVSTPITIRHLLTHTSGIGYGMIDADERFRKIFSKAGIIDAFTTTDATIADNTKKLSKLPLHHNPGEKFTYGEGLDVLGYFVELMSGKPFDQFLRQRIFDPLGMDDTWFYLPPEKHHRLVAVQQKVNGKWQPFTHELFDADYPVHGAKSFFSGGAGLSSTAMDYAKFLQMYLNMGSYNGKRILSRTTVQSIMGNQIGDLWADGPKYYGLAFGVVNEKGADMGGEGGEGTFDWGGYFNTQYFADPQEQLIGILMKQTQGPVDDPTGWRFRQMVFASIAD